MVRNTSVSDSGHLAVDRYRKTPPLGFILLLLLVLTVQPATLGASNRPVNHIDGEDMSLPPYFATSTHRGAIPDGRGTGLDITPSLALFGTDNENGCNRRFIPSSLIPPMIRLELDLTGYERFGFGGTYHVEEKKQLLYDEDANHTNVPGEFSDFNYKFTYETYVRYRHPVFAIAAGRKKPTDHGFNLIVSSNMQFLDLIEGELRAGPVLVFSLLSSLPPPHDPGEWDFGATRYFLHHGIQFALPLHLDIGVSEGVIIARRRPDLADLNPLMLWHNLVRKGNNVITGIRIAWSPPVPFSTDWEIALDDIMWDDVEPGTERPNAYGLAGKVRWDPRIRDMDLQFTLAWIQAGRWLYNREDEDLKYIVNDDFMGYWLGPGRNDIFLSLRYTPGKGKRIGLFVGRMEKGEVGIETPYPDPLSSDWGALNGTIERMTLGGVDCSWPLGKGVSLWLRWQHLAVENREHQPMRDTNHWEYFMGLTIESPPLFLPLSLPGGSTG